MIDVGIFMRLTREQRQSKAEQRTDGRLLMKFKDKVFLYCDDP